MMDKAFFLHRRKAVLPIMPVDLRADASNHSYEILAVARNWPSPPISPSRSLQRTSSTYFLGSGVVRMRMQDKTSDRWLSHCV